MHDKEIKIPEPEVVTDEERQDHEITAEDQKRIDDALAAGQLRKRKEILERVRLNHKN